MSNDFVRSMAAHPSQASHFPKWENELADDWEQWADEAIAMTIPSDEVRLPRPASYFADVVVAGFLGALFGTALFFFLLIHDGGVA